MHLRVATRLADQIRGQDAGKYLHKKEQPQTDRSNLTTAKWYKTALQHCHHSSSTCIIDRAVDSSSSTEAQLGAQHSGGHRTEGSTSLTMPLNSYRVSVPGLEWPGLEEGEAEPRDLAREEEEEGDMPPRESGAEPGAEQGTLITTWLRGE